jgi:tetratricopeptide (TPR) repeat protein
LGSALDDGARSGADGGDAASDGDGAADDVSRPRCHRRAGGKSGAASSARAAASAVVFRQSSAEDQAGQLHLAHCGEGRCGAPDGESSCTPKLLSAHEQRLATLRAASLGERVRLLKEWSRQEVLPVLSAVMRSAEADFTGMRSVGAMVQRSDSSQPVAELLDKNPQYWQAMLEMAPGNPLLLSSRLFLYVARGELDLTRLYLKPIYYFSKSDNLAHDYLEQLRDYVILFYESLDARIRVGVELHDQGRFDDAMALYDGILRDYPCSALAIYERWFAKNSRELRPVPKSERLTESSVSSRRDYSR